MGSSTSHKIASWFPNWSSSRYQPKLYLNLRWIIRPELVVCLARHPALNEKPSMNDLRGICACCWQQICWQSMSFNSFLCYGMVADKLSHAHWYHECSSDSGGPPAPLLSAACEFRSQLIDKLWEECRPDAPRSSFFACQWRIACAFCPKEGVGKMF